MQGFEARVPMEFSAFPGVKVHLISLPLAEKRRDDLAMRLSATERSRAGEITHPGRQLAYVTSRALLRGALTAATAGGVDEDAWVFETGPFGKPFVARPEGSGMRFSTSYTETLLAIAISDRFEVGVDIEALPQGGGEVPWQVLTSAERKYLHTLPADGQYLEFLRLWTIKEAYTKYLGTGASTDFRKVEVTLDPDIATAESEAASRMPEPIVRQQLVDAGSARIVLALAAAKAAT